MELHDTLVRPLVTEKTTSQLNGEEVYGFEVSLSANKVQIAQAVEALYGVRVKAVRTTIVRGKIKRYGRHMGKRSNWKKAYVTLAEGHTLDMFEG
jgi:large subunit ribosomal protein L23